LRERFFAVFERRLILHQGRNEGRV